MARLVYIFKRIGTGLRLRPWGSMLTLMACWFAVCQLFLVLFAVIIANRATLIPGTNSTVMAYLKAPQQQAAVQTIKEKLSLIDGVSHVEFIPRGEGLLRMKQWLGPDNPWIDGIDADILPDAFEIKIKTSYTGEIETLARKVGEIDAIEDVRYNKGLIGYIAGAYHTIVLAGSFIALVVIVCLGMVLFLSVRVGIMTRTQEIEVLNILGAEKTYLYAPYIIEALLYGIIGSALALITIQASISYTISRIPVLYGIVIPLNLHQVIGIFALACMFCVSGAVLAIKRNIDA
ncbi:MAG TPA: permease-like cell division protein FtsX [Deltaproteobacteria bacterium]|nr:permease-like cell division protein FtsX [Deltaproteobacteria bacterium]HPJ93873.1 permease-like cell division protein FtsX [Deltaproteobacteria bacterium]HPR51845.1 permease-like cell division protein FtsX [Deltaproteobacteria bacterium]